MIPLTVITLSIFHCILHIPVIKRTEAGSIWSPVPNYNIISDHIKRLQLLFKNYYTYKTFLKRTFKKLYFYFLEFWWQTEDFLWWLLQFDFWNFGRNRRLRLGSWIIRCHRCLAKRKVKKKKFLLILKLLFISTFMILTNAHFFKDIIWHKWDNHAYCFQDKSSLSNILGSKSDQQS